MAINHFCKYLLTHFQNYKIVIKNYRITKAIKSGKRNDTFSCTCNYCTYLISYIRGRMQVGVTFFSFALLANCTATSKTMAPHLPINPITASVALLWSSVFICLLSAINTDNGYIMNFPNRSATLARASDETGDGKTANKPDLRPINRIISERQNIVI